MFASDPRLKTAIELFHGGCFDASIERCEALWAEGMRSLPLQALLGELRLWQNRPSDAAELLWAALTEKPDSARQKAILAESYWRSDRLSQAAALHRELGRVALAAKLESRPPGIGFFQPCNRLNRHPSRRLLDNCSAPKKYDYWTGMLAIN